jgi:hypothetical protein
MITPAPLERMWINQPSTLQEFHHLHGARVLAQASVYGPFARRVWFTQGDVVSMEVPEWVLSPGWPTHLRDALMVSEPEEWFGANDPRVTDGLAVYDAERAVDGLPPFREQGEEE